VLNKVQKYYRAGEATIDNMTHAHCMLDTWGYKHTIRIHNPYNFSTAKLIGGTRLSITLHVRYLSCLIFKEFILLVLFSIQGTEFSLTNIFAFLCTWCFIYFLLILQRLCYGLGR
jgi:hypothetical protein